MKFAIGKVSYYESLGFNTENWRKSIDGTQAIVHAEFAEVLCEDDKIDIYDFQDETFKELMSSPEWTEQEEELI